MSFFSKRSPDLTETTGSLGTKPLIAQTSADMVSPVLQCWQQCNNLPSRFPRLGFFYFSPSYF
jgi:hypothetical protein